MCSRVVVKAIFDPTRHMIFNRREQLVHSYGLGVSNGKGRLMKNSKMLLVKGVCLVLIGATIATLFMNWVSISNIRTKVLAEARQDTISTVEDVKTRLLNSTVIKMDVFAENGISFDRTSIKKLASSVKTNISNIMDARISPWDLYKLSILGFKISNICKKMADIEETEDLFEVAGMSAIYNDYLNVYRESKIYYFAFPAYMLLLIVIFVTALLDAIFLVLNKRKCFSLILIILMALHTALFVAIVVFGNASLPLIAEIPKKAKLTLSLLPFVAVFLPVLLNVIKSKWLDKLEQPEY